MKVRIILICLFSVGQLFAQSDTPCGGAGAPSIPVGGTCSNSAVTIGAGDSYQSNPANFGGVTCGVSGQDVWYSFTAPASGQVDITTTAGTITDAVMALYQSDCSSGSTLIACDDDGGAGLMPMISSGALTPGLTYYIRMWAYAGGTGSLSVCVVDASVGVPPGGPNQNCANATGICGSAAFSGNSAGAGIQEMTAANSGCMSTEHQSSWYTFTALTGGTVSMSIAPQNGTDDYDFAVWGPSSPCPPSGAPARCSWAAGGGNTGLSNGAGDMTEGALGDGMVEDLNVTAGQSFVLLVDNFSSSNSPFNLNWGGSASLDCSVVLPMEVAHFNVKSERGNNLLKWSTNSIQQTSHFIVERSSDGEWFEVLSNIQVDPLNLSTAFEYQDNYYQKGLNYYRLSVIGYDGNELLSRVTSIDNSNDARKKVVKVINLMGREVNMESEGVKILIYDDGSRVKQISR